MKGKRERIRESEGSKEPLGPGESDLEISGRAAADGAGNPGEEILTEPEGRAAGSEEPPEGPEGGPSQSSKEKEYLEDLRRVTAEFANYRRRLQRERAEWEDRAKADLLTTLLPVLDDLFIARGYWSGKDVGKDAEGMQMILTRLEDLLLSSGLRVQDTEPGTPFDPHQHEALAMGCSDEHPEGTIIDTLQRGYLFRDILIRPARVRVSQGPAVAGP